MRPECNITSTGKLDTDENDSAEDEEDEDMDLYQPLFDVINLDQLAAIAVRTRQSRKIHSNNLRNSPTQAAHEHEPDENNLACKVLMPPILGAYNAVYILQFSDNTKWVARIPGKASLPSRFSALDARRMDTDLRIMRFIRDKTSIPLPEVFAWETTSDAIGAPYALMSFVTGKPISSLWFDKAINSENRRLKCLEQIAQYMCQFHALKFDKIGALFFDDQNNVIGVGEFVQLNLPEGPDDDPWGNTSTSAPFDSTKSFLLDEWDDCNDVSAEWRRQEVKIVRMAVDSIPETLLHDGSFTLTPPDFDSQNIFVDDEGNITGFIDWDSVITQPRVLGYCRYPTFITRDWDPAMYAYGEGDSTHENSPQELSYYRQIYADVFAHFGLPATEFSPDDTKLSHIVEAIEIAAGSRICRSGIVEKLLDHAFHHTVPFTYRELLDALENGKVEEWIGQIRNQFAKMWFAEWEEVAAGAGAE